MQSYYKRSIKSVTLRITLLTLSALDERNTGQQNDSRKKLKWKSRQQKKRTISFSMVSESEGHLNLQHSQTFSVNIFIF